MPVTPDQRPLYWLLLALLTATGILWARRRPAPSLTRSEGAAFLFIAILALVLRIAYARLQPPPGGFTGVEPLQSGQIAWEMLTQGVRYWEFPFERWLGAAGLAVGGPTPTALRLGFVAVGWLTVVAYFYAARGLVSTGAALATTALLAVNSWHIANGALAHAIYPGTLLVVLTLACLFRAHHGLWVVPPLAMLAATASLSYAAYRYLPLFILFWYVRFRPPRWRLHLALWAATILVLLWCYYPSLIGWWTIAGAWTEAFGRATDRGLLECPTAGWWAAPLATLWCRVLRAWHVIGAWAFLPGDMPPFAPGYRLPILDRVSGALCLLGTATLCLSRYPVHRFLGLTIAGLLFIGGVIPHNFEPRRWQGVLPFMFLGIGVLLDWLWRYPLTRRDITGAAICFCVLSGLQGYTRIADSLDRRDVQQQWFTRQAIEVAILRSLPTGAYVLLASSDVTPFRPISDWLWLVKDIRGEPLASVQDLFTRRFTDIDRPVIVVSQQQFGLAPAIRAGFPTASCTAVLDPRWWLDCGYDVCTLPAGYPLPTSPPVTVPSLPDVRRQ